MSIPLLDTSRELITPRDANGAKFVMGLHFNKVVDKVNELVVAYGTGVTPATKVGVRDNAYRSPRFTGSPIRFEDLKLIISKINSMISTDSLSVTPLSEFLIIDNSYRSADDSVIVRKLHHETLIDTVNEILGKRSAPIVVNPVPDQNYTVGFTTDTIDISNVFADPDGTTPTWSVHSNSDPGVVTVAKSGDNLIVTEVGTGTTTVVLRATDGVFFVDDTFTITVSI